MPPEAQPVELLPASTDDTDDVYVTYVDNGYYLFDRRYTNVGMAINISM